MNSRSRTCFSPLLLLFFSIMSLKTHPSMATDTISIGQSLSGNQTIVSKQGNFELGFFTPGDSHNYYIGIWYKKLSKQTAIWVANRDVPLASDSSSELKISEDGNLVLLNHFNAPIWTSNSTSSMSKSIVAVLLDTGNLVLKDGLESSAVIWQSFDHPTDTWVPGGWTGINLITGELQALTSWKSSQDPSPGSFSFRIDPGGTNQFFFLWNGSEEYWSTGIWTGEFFSLIPEMGGKSNYQFSFFKNKQRKYCTYSLNDNSVITRAVMDSNGQIKQWVWLNKTQDWMLIWSRPAQCAVDSVCGAFSICDQKTMPFCKCSYGFEPSSSRDWGLNDWSGGCARKTHLQCGDNSSTNGEKDRFLMMSNMQLPVSSQSLKVGNAEECKLACLSNCSCTAYAYGSKCSIWTGDLRNLQQLSEGEDKADTLFLRLAASELPGSNGKKIIVIEAIVGAIVGSAIVLCIVSVLIWKWQRKKFTGSGIAAGNSLVRFTFTDLQRVTRNFSEKLGGGSFGSVFKGTLPDSTTIAVKKLEGLTQGEKQFRTEVSTLGTVQHVNLVHLRGFCSEGAKRLLAYDYMPNGSLDSHIFRCDSKILEWKTRHEIILGIARGLAYLHEKCRECIIHCDIKPENILLDAEFCPKVADFGMAKLLGRDFSRVLTTVRGTIGYLAPEWLSGLPITPKADVYSFGMMVLEIISGMRNTKQFKGGSIAYFPLWATNKVNKGEILCILDEKLEGNADTEELSRASRIACWCIQDSEAHRPTMGLVVQILEGVLEVNLPPIPTSLKHLAERQSSGQSSQGSKSC